MFFQEMLMCKNKHFTIKMERKAVCRKCGARINLCPLSEVRLQIRQKKAIADPRAALLLPLRYSRVNSTAGPLLQAAAITETRSCAGRKEGCASRELNQHFPHRFHYSRQTKISQVSYSDKASTPAKHIQLTAVYCSR